MCTVSMVTSDWNKRIEDYYPNITTPIFDIISRTEFEALKKEVQEIKKLLEAAKIYDENTGQKDCESDEKVALIKRIAELVGVDLGDIFE